MSPLPALAALCVGFAPCAALAAESHAHHGSAPAEAPQPEAHADHGAHAGHDMQAGQPAPAADPHAGHTGHDAAPPPADAPADHDAHAGHQMPAADPHAGHAGHGAPAPAPAPGPAPPSDHAADAVFGAEAMEQARALLRREHGGMPWSRTMVDTLELRPGSSTHYGWEGEFGYGGDVNRLMLKSEGEGELDGAVEAGEVQALYSRAIGRYFDLQAGVRQDVQSGPSRTYATIGFEGLAPYWFDVEGALFVSNKGDLSARLEASYDLRLTQRLILEPRAELNLAASPDPGLRQGDGLVDGEFGLRLRYEFKREFAPYVGVHHERLFGDTARLARGAGETVRATRVVVGLRAFF